MYYSKFELWCFVGITDYNPFLGARSFFLKKNEQGLSAELYFKNKEMGETFSIIPTSAITYEFLFIIIIIFFFLKKGYLFIIFNFQTTDIHPKQLVNFGSWYQRGEKEGISR